MKNAMETILQGKHSFSLTQLRSEFCSHAIETKFLSHHLAQTQSQLRSTLLFCSVFYLAFSLTDFAVLGYGYDALTLFLARLSVALTAAAGSWLTWRHPHSVAATRLAATAAETVGMAAFMLVVVYRPDEMHWHAMSMAIMLIVVYLYIPNRLAYSIAVALSATATFIVLALQVTHLNAPDLLTMAMLLLLVNTFGCVAARRYQRLWREEFQAQSILKNVAILDHLTGCYNRRYLHENLFDSEIARAQRFKLCLTVIICDLDHFKNVNDTHGHRGGDAVLRTFSHLLKSMTREHIDSVVRYGGEEFLLILPETELHGSILLAERLRRAFAAATTTHEGGRTISATASFGVASVDFARNRNKITLNTLIMAADEQLYDAKNGGRNQIKSLQLA